MGLADIMRALGGAVAGPFVDQQPILRERMRRDQLMIPGPGGTGGFAGPLGDMYDVETPTGDIEEIGSRTVPSGLTRRLQSAAPGILRAALVGATTPTRHVGTGNQILGSMMAALDDRQNQDMIGYNMRRQQQQDAERSQMHQAQMDRYAADAERDRAMAQFQMSRADKPTLADEYQRFLQVAIGEYGMTIPQANAAWAKQYNPADKPPPPPTSLEGAWARSLGDPESSAQAQSAYEAAQRAKQKPPAFQRPLVFQTPQGAKLVFPSKLPEGGVGYESTDVPFERPPAAAPRARAAAGLRLMTPTQARAAQVNTVASQILRDAGGDVDKAVAAAVSDARAANILADVTRVLESSRSRKKAADGILNAESLSKILGDGPKGGSAPKGASPAPGVKRKKYNPATGRLE